MQHAAVISLSVRPSRFLFLSTTRLYPAPIFFFPISFATRFEMADIADSLMPRQHHDRSLANDASVKSNSPCGFRVINQWH